VLGFRETWTIENQRKFFDQIALEKKIQTLEGWYDISSSFIQQRGGASILVKYNGSLIKALCTIYPENNFQLWKFEKVPQKYWAVCISKVVFS